MESTNVPTQYIKLVYHEQTTVPGLSLLTVCRGRVTVYSGEQVYYYTAPECKFLPSPDCVLTGLDTVNTVLVSSLAE